MIRQVRKAGGPRPGPRWERRERRPARAGGHHPAARCRRVCAGTLLRSLVLSRSWSSVRSGCGIHAAYGRPNHRSSPPPWPVPPTLPCRFGRLLPPRAQSPVPPSKCAFPSVTRSRRARVTPPPRATVASAPLRRLCGLTGPLRSPGGCSRSPARLPRAVHRSLTSLLVYPEGGKWPPMCLVPVHPVLSARRIRNIPTGVHTFACTDRPREDA